MITVIFTCLLKLLSQANDGLFFTFRQVYVEQLHHNDLLYITAALYPQLSEDIRSKMISFNGEVRVTILHVSMHLQRSGRGLVVTVLDSGL